MKIFETLADSPSFRKGAKQVAAVPEIPSSAEPEIISSPPEIASAAEPDPVQEVVSSRKPLRLVPGNSKYTIPLDSRSGDARPSRVLMRNCNSCASYDEGWCYSVTARTFYNIKLLKACPPGAYRWKYN